MPESQKQIYHRIYVRVTPYEFRIFQEMRNKHNLSARDVLEYSGMPCEPCCTGDVIIFDKKTDEPISIPRGILKNKIRLYKKSQ